MLLTTDEADRIERRVAALEGRTGVQVVTALVPRADHYPEIPWTAFALGASLGALAAVVSDLLHPVWPSATSAVMHALAVLGAGGAWAIGAVASPAVARLFLRRGRAEGEVRQCAEAMFLARELFRTPERRGVLLLAALFERQVVVVPDTGLRDRVAPEAWREVVARMAPDLAAGRRGRALEAGLEALEAILTRSGFTGGGGPAGTHLPDRPVEEGGP